MRIALVVAAGGMDVAYCEDVLRLAGHATERVPAEAAAIEGFDAAFAGLDSARNLGWLGAPRPRRVRAIVASRFAALLAPLRARNDLRLLVEPATPEEVLAAIEERPAPPRLPPADGGYDWSSHDARLAAAGLGDVEPDAQLGSIASLAARGLGVPIAFVAVVDSKRQRFVGEHGLPDDLRAAGGTPREWSFCQHVVGAEAPLVVEDAADQPALAHTPLVRFGVVRAYAGVPVRSQGCVVGTVCALSTERRAFTASEVATLELAARAAEARLEALRAATPVSVAPSDAVTAAPAPRPAGRSEDLVGGVIDAKYLVTARLGEGGMARVYLARDRDLGRLVALKVLDARLDDALLLREARQIASIRHPCIVQLFDWGRLEGGRPYLVLEYVRGESLKERIESLVRARAWMPRDAVLGVLRNVAGALETLHGAGLVHGDVKPGNVIMDDALARVVLIDFGLAIGAADGPAAKITGGTPGYSAPEQLVGEGVAGAPATLDVYALGVLAYVLLTFTAPFAGLPHLVRLEAQREGAFRAPSSVRPDLGAVVDAVLQRALAPRPEDRFGTVSALLDALEQAVPGGRPDAKLSTASMLAVIDRDREPRTRGDAIARVREGVARAIGAAREAALVASLDAPRAAAVDAAARDRAALFPTVAYSAYLRAYAAGDRARIASLVERVTAATIPAQLAAFQIERAPHTVLRAAESIFRRVHTWGALRFARESADRSRIELAMPRDLAPEQCAAFEGAVRATLLWVRHEARVRQVACVADGAPACVFEAEWSIT